MSVIYRDPNEPEQKLIDGICLCVLYVIAFFTILFTFPGCQADDQRQQYQPFYDPQSKRPVEKIRKPIHDAATRVDDVLEKTPVPAVAEILVDNALETIEQIKPLPEPTAGFVMSDSTVNCSYPLPIRLFRQLFRQSIRNRKQLSEPNSTKLAFQNSTPGLCVLYITA